jgi:anti-sigma factor RsiW
MNRFLPNDELLSAYLDGEVTAGERELVERALREIPAVRQSLEELRRLQDGVRSLPRYHLEPDFCQGVLRQAERAMLSPSAQVPGAQVPGAQVLGEAHFATATLKPALMPEERDQPKPQFVAAPHRSQGGPSAAPGSVWQPRWRCSLLPWH